MDLTQLHPCSSAKFKNNFLILENIIKIFTIFYLGNFQFSNLLAAVRISPLEVNLRHSDCLTKFLTSGRSVLLEGANKEPGTAPQVSHMLSCHGGDIYLHKRQGIQNNVTEPPALADGEVFIF